MIVADCSTAEPSSTLKVAADIEKKGGRFADTPLTPARRTKPRPASSAS